jgi:NTP pyrophosphatase (non-canonical NTP hydrolase)
VKGSFQSDQLMILRCLGEIEEVGELSEEKTKLENIGEEVLRWGGAGNVAR